MRVLVGQKPALLVAVAISLLAAAGASAATLHPQLLAKVGYGATPVGFARTGDGVLHVAYESNINWGDGANGVGALAISPSGHVGPQVQALNWGTSGGSPSGIPGLAALPSGTLEATFGGSPGGDDGPWGISSTDGGSSWSAPVDIGSGSMEFGDGAVGAQVSNGTPVLAAGCCGGIVIQDGLGFGSPTYQLTNNTDDVAGNTSSAVDAATGAVVAGWDSNAGSGGMWFQQVAPSTGSAVELPVPKQYGTGVPLIVAGRDKGSGVFAAYPANYANTTHITLARYDGGSVGVGSVSHVHADVWGAASGSDGRMWVFWYGQNTKTGKYEMAVTRSNNAVNAFEPIQVFKLDYSSVSALEGDGRLGPLDMLITGTPAAPGSAGGIYWARFIPELSAHIKVTDLGGGKFKLKVTVTDAGDPVSGAKVSADGKHKTTKGTGRAKLVIAGSSGHHATVTVSAPGYRTLEEHVSL